MKRPATASNRLRRPWIALPHWLIKQAIFTYLEQLDRGLTPPEHSGLAAAAGEEAVETLTEQGIQVFLEFAEHSAPVRAGGPSRGLSPP